MYKKPLFFLLFISFCTNCFGQVSQAELDKMMNEAKDMLKQMGGDSLAQQKLKELERNEKQLKEIIKNAGSFEKGQSVIVPGKEKMPVKQVKLLQTLTKRILSKEEVKAFAGTLYSELQKFVKPSSLQSVKKIIQNLDNNAYFISNAAIYAWLNKSSEQSALLAVYAASQNGEDNILNNCGAILNLAGLEAKAIPILKSLLPANATNSTVLNNIGQAFAGLGEKDSALFYLGACMKQSPNHPEACATAAYLEREKGNIEKAKQLLQKSLEGAYTDEAGRVVRFLDPDFRINRFTKPQIKVPEYFNIHQYLPFPQPCTSIADIPRAVGEYKAFNQMLEQDLEKLGNLERDLTEQMQNNTPATNVGYLVPDGHIMRTSFYKLCTEVNTDIAKEFRNDLITYDQQAAHYKKEKTKLDENYKQERALIEKQFQRKENCCGEGNAACCDDYYKMCRSLDELANKYLPKYALLLKDLQAKVVLPYRNFNETAYWNYLTYSPMIPKPVGMLTFRSAFYVSAINYLKALQTLAHPVIIDPCEKGPELNASREGGDIKEPECPIDLTIPFVIGKMKLNCEAFKLEINLKIATLDIEDGFNGRPFTIAAGVGIVPKFLGVQGGLQQEVFITIDKNNQVSDFGIQQTGKVSVPFTLDEKAGWKLGVNSGWSFNEGALKPIADKIFGLQETQINKNVNIYKPN